MAGEAWQEAQPLPPEETLADLFQRLRPVLRGILRRHRVPACEAEDLLQDVVVAALEAWPRIHSKEAWLCRVLACRCVEYHRRQRVRTAALADPQQEEPVRPLAAWDAALDARRLCRQISRRSRRALVLRFALGLRYAEVAERLGWKNAGVARRSIVRSLESIRRAGGGAEVR